MRSLTITLLLICSEVSFAEEVIKSSDMQIIICAGGGLLPVNNSSKIKSTYSNGFSDTTRETVKYDSAYRIGGDLTILPQSNEPIGLALWGGLTYDRYALSDSGNGASFSTSNQGVSMDVGAGPCFHPHKKITIDIMPFVGGFLGSENYTANYNDGSKLNFYEFSPGYSYGIKADMIIFTEQKFTFKATFGYISTTLTANGTADYYAPPGTHWTINNSNVQGVKVNDTETFSGVYALIGFGVTIP